MKSFVEKCLKDKDISAKKILYKANSVIFSAMDVSQAMYLIELGRVQILKRLPDTNKEIVLATFGPNEFFGELSLIIGRPHSAEAVALTDCTLWVLDEKTFKEAVARSPEFSLLIMQGLANKLNSMNEKQKEILSHLREFTERLEDFSTLWHAFIL